MDKETRDKFTQIEIDNGIKDGIDKRIRTICITSTLAVWGFIVWFGAQVYDKFPSFKAAVIAFIQADKGIK